MQVIIIIINMNNITYIVTNEGLNTVQTVSVVHWASL